MVLKEKKWCIIVTMETHFTDPFFSSIYEYFSRLNKSCSYIKQGQASRKRGVSSLSKGTDMNRNEEF